MTDVSVTHARRQQSDSCHQQYLLAAATVAHVRSEDSGDWWRYDDSEVTRMAKGPAGEHADHGIAADRKARQSHPSFHCNALHPALVFTELMDSSS